MQRNPALYLRVSTDAATEKGWNVVAVYEDAGISGANGRDKRPGFDAMLKDTVRRRFEHLSAAGRRGAPPSKGDRAWAKRMAVSDFSPMLKAKYLGEPRRWAKLSEDLGISAVFAGAILVKTNPELVAGWSGPRMRRGRTRHGWP